MILKVEYVHKAYGKKTILEDINLAIQAHEIIAFVGANGAGKTTLMKCILGFLPFDGEITVAHEKVRFGETASNAYIGYLPDVPQFYPFYTAKQYLKMCQKISGNVTDERVDEMLKLVGLENRAEKIQQYSRGMKQRLGIAQALLHKPKLLICDEPTSALDPEGREQVLKILQEAKKETAILFSTHILSEAERISDRMLILHDKEIKFDGPLQRRNSNGCYYVEFMTDIDQVMFKEFQLERANDGWLFECLNEESKSKFMQRVLEAGYSLKKFYPQEETLEQFVKGVTER